MKRQLTSILLLLIGLGSPLLAQQTYALKPYAITLPRLTTAQQSTSAPQQEGNVVYNTDQKQLAVHNGTTWQYLAPPETAQFKNAQRFLSGENQSWIVPAGVTRIMAEVWGGGSGGPIYAYSNNSELLANGGGAGGYARGFIAVTPGQTLTLTVGAGGRAAIRSTNQTPGNGTDSFIKKVGFYEEIGAEGGRVFPNYGGGIGGRSYGPAVGFTVSGDNGSPGLISYGQRSASEYILLIKCGDGGTAYGASQGGIGTQISSVNSSYLLYTLGDDKYSQNGSYPGGGGGCGYNVGGTGGNGMIVIYW
ncbi:MAG: hypothetical protein EAZ91_21725 [Cytophagales bacterium]|nr:MAG: hypothetical protein EAZ91_21725 [Cytophagales bacterium]